MEKINERTQKMPSLFWGIVGVAVFLLLLFIFTVGFSLFFVITFAAWGWFILWVKRAVVTGVLITQKTVIIFVVMVIMTLLFMRAGGVRNSADNDTKDSIDKGGSADIVQNEAYTGQVFANVLTNNASWMTGDSNSRIVDYTITAVATLYPTEKITKVTVKNVQLENTPKGSVTLLLPTGGYSEKLDGANTIDIPVVGKEARAQANQAHEGFASISLQVKVEDAYRFDVNKAFKMSTKGLQGSRSFQYASVTPSALDNVITFDVELMFSSGETVTKHFTGHVSGQEFYDTGMVKNSPLEVE